MQRFAHTATCWLLLITFGGMSTVGPYWHRHSGSDHLASGHCSCSPITNPNSVGTCDESISELEACEETPSACQWVSGGEAIKSDLALRHSHDVCHHADLAADCQLAEAGHSHRPATPSSQTSDQATCSEHAHQTPVLVQGDPHDNCSLCRFYALAKVSSPADRIAADHDSVAALPLLPAQLSFGSPLETRSRGPPQSLLA